MSTPCSSLNCLNKNHLSIFASPMWTPSGQKREHRNSPQPHSTSSDGSSPSPRPASPIRIVGLAFMKAAKQPVFPFPWICPIVSQPVRACQLIKTPDFSRPSLSYIGSRKTVCHLSLVLMIIAERLPRSGVLRSAKTSTSVSCEYDVDIHPVTGNFYSMVDHKSVRLFLYADTGHCFTFVIRHNLLSCCSDTFDGTVADELMGKIVC